MHLEGPKGDIRIIGNHFQDCYVAGGNQGHIYIGHSDKTVIVANNEFRQTVSAIGTTFAIDASSGGLSPRIVFVGNRVYDSGAGLSGLLLSFTSGSALIANNEFRACTYGVTAVSATGILVEGNWFVSCGTGINSDLAGASNGSATDLMVQRNRFIGSSSSNVIARANTSGTGKPARWVLSGNWFDNDVLVYDGTDIFAHGNYVAGVHIQHPR